MSRTAARLVFGTLLVGVGVGVGVLTLGAEPAHAADEQPAVVVEQPGGVLDQVTDRKAERKAEREARRAEREKRKAEREKRRQERDQEQATEPAPRPEQPAEPPATEPAPEPEQPTPVIGRPVLDPEPVVEVIEDVADTVDEVTEQLPATEPRTEPSYDWAAPVPVSAPVVTAPAPVPPVLLPMLIGPVPAADAPVADGIRPAAPRSGDDDPAPLCGEERARPAVDPPAAKKAGKGKRKGAAATKPGKPCPVTPIGPDGPAIVQPSMKPPTANPIDQLGDTTAALTWPTLHRLTQLRPRSHMPAGRDEHVEPAPA